MSSGLPYENRGLATEQVIFAGTERAEVGRELGTTVLPGNPSP